MTRVMRHRAVAGRARQKIRAGTYLAVSTDVSKARSGLDQLMSRDNTVSSIQLSDLR
jgi:hypothetical protein